VALGDPETVAGRTGFGAMSVPTVVVLDAEGRMAWRKNGLAKSDELRQVLVSIERAASLHRPD
jgi:predicted transcriptional regulator